MGRRGESAAVWAREETGRGELVLRQREGADGETVYEIILNGAFLMASTNAPSARALAHLGLEPLGKQAGKRVLVGGLGIGYTLQAVLEHPEVARVEVVEIEPLIVEWARTCFSPLNGNGLADARVEVVVADLARYLEEATGPYDAILLDVDNGPTWPVLEENAALYTRRALERLRALLAPGGILAVWASEQAPDFLSELKAGFAWADEVMVEETSEGRRVEYFIYRAGTSG